MLNVVMYTEMTKAQQTNHVQTLNLYRSMRFPESTEKFQCFSLSSVPKIDPQKYLPSFSHQV